MASSKSKRIIFTGGSGDAGRHCVEYLVQQGHSVLNLDNRPLELPGVHTLITDLTKAGEVYSAFSNTLFAREEYFNTPLSYPTVDAVIHFAAFPRPLTVPDNRVFLDNVAMTFNVIEAACKLGIRKIVLASSQSIYGAAYSQHEPTWQEFPVYEDHPCNPTDSYALSKICSEETGRSYASRFGIDIYALRPGYVITPGLYSEVTRPFLDDPSKGLKVAWSYTDARDLGQLCHLCVMTSGLGWQVFNAVNDRALSQVPIPEVVQQTCPGLKVTREMEEWEAPTSNEKAKRLLAFRPEYEWTQEVMVEAEKRKG